MNKQAVLDDLDEKLEKYSEVFQAIALQNTEKDKEDTEEDEE